MHCPSGPYAAEFNAFITEYTETRFDADRNWFDRLLENDSRQRGSTTPIEAEELQVIPYKVPINATTPFAGWTDCTWLPKSWTEAGVSQSQADTVGSLWITRHLGATHRGHRDADEIFNDGIGRLFMPLGPGECNQLIIAFPASCFLLLGHSMQGHWTFLQSLSPKDYEAFVKEHAWQCLLTKGSVVWIPYGYVCSIVAIGHEKTIQWSMHFCLVSVKLWKAVENDTRIVF